LSPRLREIPVNPRSLAAIICSGASIFVFQNATVAPTKRNALIGTSFNVAVGSGVAMTNPARNDDRMITSCLGLTQTTLSGMPRLDQRLVSLNQRILTTLGEGAPKLNEPVGGFRKLVDF